MNYLKNFLSFKLVIALLFAIPVHGQSVVGEWGGNVQSFQNLDCSGDPFLTNDLSVVITETNVDGYVSASYTYETLCGMFGGTIDEAGNCLDMTQEELMNFACPMLGGTMNGETCDAFQPVNGTYTLTNDQFCITTLDPETGLEGEECGTLVYNENGFVVTYIYPAQSEDETDACTNWTFNTLENDGPGFSLAFDGLDDRVNLQSSFLSGVDNTFSILSRFKINNSEAGNQAIWFHRAHYRDHGLQYIQNDNVFKYGQLTYPNVQEGFWYDVAIVYDNGNLAMYVNGQLVSSTTSETSYDWSDSFIGAYFGSDNGFYNVWLDGKIDQIAAFDGDGHVDVGNG